MQLSDVKQTWNGQVIEAALSPRVKIGGQTAFSRHAFEGAFPNRPQVALEVFDVLPDELKGVFADSVGRQVLEDPVAWSKEAVKEHGADLLFFNMLR